MRCQDVRNLLPELVRGDLNPAAEAMLQGHIEDCRACTGALAREQQLQTSLKAIPVPPMRSDFAARALREASVADRPALRRVLDHPLALAASIVMVWPVGWGKSRICPDPGWTCSLKVSATEATTLTSVPPAGGA